jgi:hypothetical protein
LSDDNYRAFPQREFFRLLLSVQLQFLSICSNVNVLSMYKDKADSHLKRSPSR